MDDPISDREFLNHFMVIEKEILSPTYEFLFNNFESYNDDKQFRLLILINIFFFTNVTNEINKSDFEFLEFVVCKMILNEKYFNYGLISLHLFIQRFSDYNLNLFMGRLKADYRKQLHDILIRGITKNEDINKNPDNFFNTLYDISLGPAFYFYIQNLSYNHFFEKIFGYDFIKYRKESLEPYKEQIIKTIESNLDKTFESENIFTLLKSVYLLFYDERSNFFKSIDIKIEDNMKSGEKIQKALELTQFLNNNYPTHTFFKKFYKSYFNMVRHLNENLDNIQIIGELLDAFNYYSIRDSRTGGLVDRAFFKQLLIDLEFLYRTGNSVKLNEAYQRIESLIDLIPRMMKNLNVAKLKNSNNVSSIDDESLKKEFFPFLKPTHTFKQDFGQKEIFILQDKLEKMKEKCAQGITAQDREKCEKIPNKICLTKLFSYPLGKGVLPHCGAELVDCFWISKNDGNAIVIKGANMRTKKQYMDPLSQINDLTQRNTVKTIFFANNKSTSNKFQSQALNLCKANKKQFITFNKDELIQFLHFYETTNQPKEEVADN